MVAAAKFLVAGTKNLFVVPNFVAVTKLFFSVKKCLLTQVVQQVVLDCGKRYPKINPWGAFGSRSALRYPRYLQFKVQSGKYLRAPAVSLTLTLLPQYFTPCQTLFA